MTRRDLLAEAARQAALGAVALSGGAALAQAAEPTRHAPPTVETLDDGITLVTLPEPEAAGVVWEAFFRVGLGDEGTQRGIRSLIARRWVGDTKWRTPGSLAGDLSRAGSATGTSCGADWVELWGTGAGDDYSVELSAQALFTNIVAGATFSRETVESARAEQKNEMALRRDDLVQNVLDEARARAFGESPYALGFLGEEGSVSSIPAAQVERFYRRYFRPERAVIVAAGSITPEEARHRVTASFGAASWDSAAPPAPPERAAPLAIAPAGMRDHVLRRRAPAVCVALAYLAPGAKGGSGREDYAALLVLEAALRGGKSSRLFALRDRPEDGEPPLGYEVRTVLAPGMGQSLLTVYVAGEQPAAAVRDRLTHALRAVASGERPLTDAEIERARTYVIARHGESRQRLKDRAFGAGWAETMGLGAAFDADFDLRIAGVGTDSVMRVARQVLGNAPAVVYSQPLAG